MTTMNCLRRLTQECLRFKGRLLLGAIALISLAVTRLYLTWLIKLWVEGPLENGEAGAVRWLITVGLLGTGCMVIAIFLSRYLLNDVNQRMLQGLRNQMQERLLKMRVADVWRFQSGDLISRIFNDIDNLSFFVRDILERIIGEGIVAVCSIGMMFYLDWRLALIISIMAPVAGIILIGLTRAIRRSAAKARYRFGWLSAIFTEQLRGITTIKSFQTESFEQDRFTAQNTAYRRQDMRCHLRSDVLLSAIWLITGLALLGMIWYGSRQVMSGELSAGALLAFCLYAGQTVEPIRRFSDVLAGLQRSVASATRVFEVINHDAGDSGDSSSIRISPRGGLVFDSVDFHYNGDDLVLDGVDFDLKPREMVGLVSASGGGKSTLGKLLMRFHEPMSGRILLDGTDIRNLPMVDLRRAVCVVEQEPFMFSGPLIDNIRYGTWSAPIKIVESAVELAGLESVLDAVPNGLHTHLDESGRSLSGGQKQRIALARAIVRDPSILVLDEATSALDSDTERLIFSRLEEWMSHRTVLIMAHRLSTIQRLPRILVLDGGRIVGNASVPELVAHCATFRQLFSEQLQAPL